MPTAWTLVLAARDHRQRRLAGINGELAALARQSVLRESLRLVKHGLLIGGYWAAYVFGKPQLWVIPVVCWLLSGTSVHELWFRHWLEDRRKRARLVRPKP